MDIRSEVYNALAEIMFKTGANQKDMDEAIEWFQIHFYESEETPEQKAQAFFNSFSIISLYSSK